MNTTPPKQQQQQQQQKGRGHPDSSLHPFEFKSIFLPLSSVPTFCSTTDVCLSVRRIVISSQLNCLPIRLSVFLSLSVCLLLCLPPSRPPVCLFAFILLCLFFYVCQSVYLSVRLSVSLCVLLFLFSSCLSGPKLCLSIALPVFPRLSVSQLCLSVDPPPVCLFLMYACLLLYLSFHARLYIVLPAFLRLSLCIMHVYFLPVDCSTCCSMSVRPCLPVCCSVSSCLSVFLPLPLFISLSS